VASSADVVYIGIKGHVVAVAAVSGEELWRTKVKRSTYITICVQPNAIYAGASGHLFCLDPSTGAIRWENRLPGLGTGLITFGESTPVIASAAAAAAAAAGAGAASAG
jgi:outer membrane protein assembly factor BamB